MLRRAGPPKIVYSQHTKGVYGVAIQGPYVVSGSDDKTARVVNRNTGARYAAGRHDFVHSSLFGRASGSGVYESLGPGVALPPPPFESLPALQPPPPSGGNRHFPGEA